MKKIFILFILTILFATQSIARQPSEKKIKKWLNQNNFTIESIQNIYLLENERAYLAEIIFTGKDIHIKKGLVLVRPDLEEAEFIPPFPQDYVVTDLDHDGVSEIIFSHEHSYDTYTSYKRSLVQLHDYKRFELYATEYSEEKNCKLCLIEDIQWGFEDLNNDRTKDLKQEYALHVQSAYNDFVFKEKTEEIEFNPKGLKLPFRKIGLNLSAMELAQDVVDRVPIMPSQDFHLQDERIYCFLDFENVKQQEAVTYHWIHEKLGEVLRIKQNIQPAARFRTWLYKSLKDEEKYLGDWIIIISDEHMNVLGSKEFTISKKTTTPDIEQDHEDVNATYQGTSIINFDMNTAHLDVNNTQNESNVSN